MTGNIWLDAWLWCVLMPMLGVLAVGVVIELWERRR